MASRSRTLQLPFSHTSDLCGFSNSHCNVYVAHFWLHQVVIGAPVPVTPTEHAGQFKLHQCISQEIAAHNGKWIPKGYRKGLKMLIFRVRVK